MQTNLERVDRQLVNVQIELQKLEIIVEQMGRVPSGIGDKGLVETIRHHREALLGASRGINERIERICRLP
jgi:hypothetical protein